MDNKYKYCLRSYKNTAALWWVLPLTLLLCFFQEGIGFIVLLWIWYILYCIKNNKDLQYDMYIIRKRKEYFDSLKNK